MSTETQAWESVCRFMDTHSGVKLAQSQAYLMASRLEPVAKTMGFQSVTDFVGAACALGATAQHKNALIDAMTTHETSFFRDQSFWKTMQETVLPKLNKSSSSKIRVLSTACSHGQEAYSLVMMIQESFASLLERVEVVGSDIAEHSLEKARLGVFSNLEVNRGLTAPRILKHFDKAPGGFKVKDTIRNKVKFESHNLLEPLPQAGMYAMVLCRNVLIYFESDVRQRVLAHLLKGVHKEGFIGLGAGELYLGSPLPGGIYDNSQLKGHV